MTSIVFIFLLTGLVSGFIAGLLGVGGGIIIVPVTYFILLNLGYSSEIVMHVAVASSLGVICFTSISSIRSHVKLKNKKLLNKMKPNSLFILMSRAAVVNFKDLVTRLKKGDIYVATDVFPEEPVRKNDPIRKVKNILFSAHRAGALKEAFFDMGNIVLKDMDLILKNQKPKYCKKAQLKTVEDIMITGSAIPLVDENIKTVLIEDISDLDLRFMYQGTWYERWPSAPITERKIPTLIKLEFTKNNKDYVWIIEPNIDYEFKN